MQRATLWQMYSTEDKVVVNIEHEYRVVTPTLFGINPWSTGTHESGINGFLEQLMVTADNTAAMIDY